MAVDLLDTVSRGVVGILPYAGIFLLLSGIFHVVHDRITPFDDQALRKSGNRAASYNRFGAHVGFALAVCGSLPHREAVYWDDVAMFALDGLIVLPVFIIAHYVLDLAILWGIDNSKEIERDNRAAGIVEACAYIAIGLVTFASFSGGGQSTLEGLASGVAFSLTGVITTAGVVAAYMWLRYKLTGCDIDSEIHCGNQAAALDAGTLLLALGITQAFSIFGDSAGWGQDFLSYGIALVASLIAVFLARGAALLWMARGLPKTISGIHHESVAKSLQLGAVSIGAGLLVGLVTFV